jgi:hypothetical protein
MEFIVINKLFQSIFERYITKEDIQSAQNIGYIADKICGVAIGNYKWDLNNNIIHSNTLSFVIEEGLKNIANYNLDNYVLRNDHAFTLANIQEYLEERPSDISLNDYINLTAIICFNYVEIKATNHYSEIIKQGKVKLYHYLALHTSRKIKTYDYDNILNVSKNFGNLGLDFLI